jgi:hypothetical protein
MNIPYKQKHMSEIKLEELAANLEEYVKAEIAIAKLRATEKIAASGGNIFALYVVSLVALACALLIGVTAGLFLSSIWESYTAGFLTVSGVYVLALLFLWFFRKKLLSLPARNKIIADMLDED